MTGPPSKRPTTETPAGLRVRPSQNQSAVPEERVAGTPGAREGDLAPAQTPPGGRDKVATRVLRRVKIPPQALSTLESLSSPSRLGRVPAPLLTTLDRWARSSTCTAGGAPPCQGKRDGLSDLERRRAGSSRMGQDPLLPRKHLGVTCMHGAGQGGSDPCRLAPQLLRDKADDLGEQVIEWLMERESRTGALWNEVRRQHADGPPHSGSWHDYLESRWQQVDSNTLVALASVLSRRVHVYDWIASDLHDPRTRTEWALVATVRPIPPSAEPYTGEWRADPIRLGMRERPRFSSKCGMVSAVPDS